MRTLTFTALLLLTAICPLLAQKNFKPATVVLANGDSIRGFIRHDNWRITPSKIRFKKDEVSEIQTLRPADIKQFTVGGETFISAITDIDTRFDDLQRTNNDEKIYTRVDTLFLKLQVSGPKPLYSYYDNVYHFYILRNDTIELLRFKKFETPHANSIDGLSNRGRAVKFQDTYLWQLQEYLEDCNASKPTVVSTPYTLKGMITSFQAYYNCKGIDYVGPKNAPVRKPEFIVRVGGNLQNFRGKDATGKSLDHKSALRFNAGIVSDLHIKGSFYLQPGILYNMKGAKLNESEERDLTLGYIEVPLSLVYKPSVGASNLVVGAGPYMAFGMSGKIKGGSSGNAKVTFDNEVGLMQYTTTPYIVRKMDFGAIFFIGYEIAPRLAAQFNAQFGFTDIQPIVVGTYDLTGSAKNTGYGISVGYKIF